MVFLLYTLRHTVRGFAVFSVVIGRIKLVELTTSIVPPTISICGYVGAKYIPYDIRALNILMYTSQRVFVYTKDKILSYIFQN